MKMNERYSHIVSDKNLCQDKFLAIYGLYGYSQGLSHEEASVDSGVGEIFNTLSRHIYQTFKR